jgi:hypothetical protein
MKADEDGVFGRARRHARRHVRRASLFGNRHIYGPGGIDLYTRGKVVTSRRPDPATSQVDLGVPQTR